MYVTVDLDVFGCDGSIVDTIMNQLISGVCRVVRDLHSNTNFIKKVSVCAGFCRKICHRYALEIGVNSHESDDSDFCCMHVS